MNQANQRINLLLRYGLGMEWKVVHDKPIRSQKKKKQNVILKVFFTCL